MKVSADRQLKVADEVVLFALNQRVSRHFRERQRFRSKRMPAAWLSVALRPVLLAQHLSRLVLPPEARRLSRRLRI